MTSAEVAWENSIPVSQLLDDHPDLRLRADDLVWEVVDVAIAELVGRYAPGGYYREEAAYMAQLTAAFQAGELPLPAFIRRPDGYHHADGAHRTVMHMRLGHTHIRSYVATP